MLCEPLVLAVWQEEVSAYIKKNGFTLSVQTLNAARFDYDGREKWNIDFLICYTPKIEIRGS